MGNTAEAINMITQTKRFHGTELDLSGLQLTPAEFKELIPQIKEIEGLKALDISNNNINEIPDEIAELATVTKLNAGHNNIEEISNGVLNMKNLENLQLDGNSITTIPDGIANLTQLTGLSFYRNKLTGLNPAIGQLNNLIMLNVTINEITEFPNELTNLTNLQILAAKRNNLTELPEGMGNMQSLERIDLEENQIARVPESLAQLTNLTELNLESNRIRVLPEQLQNLTNLEEINLQDNPLTNETMNWLNNNFANGVVSYNMEAYGELPELSEVLEVLYPEDAREIEGQINNLTKDGFVTEKNETLKANAVVTEFLRKIPLSDPYLKEVYAPIAKSLLATILDTQQPEAVRDDLVHSMATTCGDCETPVKDFIVQKAIGKFREEANPEKQGLLEKLIQREALEEKITKALKDKIRPNEQIEQVQALLNSVFYEGAENRPENKVKISGERSRMPSKSYYITPGFTMVSEQLAKAFAEMVCQTDATTNQLATDANGNYLLDPKKLTLITEQYKAGLGIVSEREKLINQFEIQVNTAIANYELALHTEHEEVLPLLKTNEQKESLRDLLNSAKDENVQQVYQNYLNERLAEITRVGEQIKPIDAKLATMTSPTNADKRTKRDRSPSPDTKGKQSVAKTPKF